MLFTPFFLRRLGPRVEVTGSRASDGPEPGIIRDKDLYTTTNKYLQCIIKIMYSIF